MNTFDEHLEELVQTANVAELNYKIWWIYKHERPAYVGVMNTYLGFFRASIYAHFVAMLMALYKLGDPRPDSASLKTLLAEAEGDPSFDPKVIMSAREKLVALEPTWQKVRKLRHKQFAHRDRYLDYEELLADVAITYDDFRDLIDQFFKALNEILYYRKRTTWPRDTRTERDTHRMLDTLKLVNKDRAPNPTAPADG
jgi:hypothetical protein